MLSNSSILELADHPEGWGSGDRVVVASTDYSMHQAEEFTLLPCPTCKPNQIKVQGEVTYYMLPNRNSAVKIQAYYSTGGRVVKSVLLHAPSAPLSHDSCLDTVN